VTTVDELRSQARQARQDADALRALAAGLDQSVIHDLAHLAGDRTWVGPAASRLEQAVRAARYQLHEAAGDLRRVAAVLDQEATDLDRAGRSLMFAVA
jgi:hypothetical protein